MALSHGVIITDVPLHQTKPQCLCLLKLKKKSSNNFSMTYWLVLLLLDSFIEVPCIITNYPGDSIDCQFELSLQYLYSGKINTCLSVKTKKEICS